MKIGSRIFLKKHNIWVNYNDLTATEAWESWFRYGGIIPKWPQDSVKYYNLPRQYDIPIYSRVLHEIYQSL